jgi:hypothetical protein
MAANTEKNASKMQACLRMLDQLNDAWKQAYDTSQAAIHAAAAASVAPAVPTAVDGAGAVVPVGTGS